MFGFSQGDFLRLIWNAGHFQEDVYRSTRLGHQIIIVRQRHLKTKSQIYLDSKGRFSIQFQYRYTSKKRKRFIYQNIVEIRFVEMNTRKIRLKSSSTRVKRPRWGMCDRRWWWRKTFQWDAWKVNEEKEKEREWKAELVLTNELEWFYPNVQRQSIERVVWSDRLKILLS